MAPVPMLWGHLPEGTQTFPGGRSQERSEAGVVREEGLGQGVLGGAKILLGLGLLELRWGMEGKVRPSWKHRWGTTRGPSSAKHG